MCRKSSFETHGKRDEKLFEKSKSSVESESYECEANQTCLIRVQDTRAQKTISIQV